MSETIDELKAAVERVRSVDYAGPFAWAMEAADEKLLAGAYLRHLDNQQRIAAERALPIDLTWLESIGFRESHEREFDCRWIGVERGSGLSVEYDCESGRFCILDEYSSVRNEQADTVSRGNILDLLAALKIETKGM